MDVVMASTKLFVGNLPYKLTEDELKNHFESKGAVVSARIITDRETGRSRGFGFVEMESPEMAREAMNGLDGSELLGRNISVNEATEKARR